MGLSGLSLSVFPVKPHAFLHSLRVLDKHFARTCNEGNTPRPSEEGHPFQFPGNPIPKPVGFAVVSSPVLPLALLGRRQREGGIWEEAAAPLTCWVFLSAGACGAGQKGSADLERDGERAKLELMEGRCHSSSSARELFPLSGRTLASSPQKTRLPAGSLQIEAGRKALTT